MHQLILILGFVLLPQVATLRCYECSGLGPCENRIQTCEAPTTQCGAMRTLFYQDNSKIADVTSKSCTVLEGCLNGSLNFGIARTVYASKCCNSELCNKDSVPEPPRSNPNGRKCYTCTADQQSCSHVLNCEGTEDYCVSASVTAEGQSVTMKGCVSKNICASTTLMKNNEIEYSCCQGDLCNSASSSSASLLLLLTPFIPLLTFS